MASAPDPTPAPAPAPDAQAPAPVPAQPGNDDMIPVDVDDIMAVFGEGPSEASKMPNFGSPTEQPPTPEPPTPQPAPAAAPSLPAAAPGAAAPTPPAPAVPQPLPGIQEPSPAPAPVLTPDALRVASLEAQVAALQQVVEQQRAAPGTPSAPAQPEQLVKPEETNYRLTIPNEVISAVFNEDAGVAAGGMTHLVNSLASIIHRNVLHMARQDINSLRSEIHSGSAQDEQSRARDAAQAEYYKDFPTHNNPHVKILVAAEAQKLGVEYPGLPWGDQFKNALGARVNAVLESLGAGATPPAPAPSAPNGLDPTAPVQLKPPAKPAGFMPVAPSGGIPSFENDQDIIAQTFSFGN